MYNMRTYDPFVTELSTRADSVSVSVRCYLSEAAVLSLCTLSALRKCLTMWVFKGESCTHLSGTECLLAQRGLFRKTHFICLENIHGCEARLTGPHTNNENSGLQGSSIHLKTYGSEIQNSEFRCVVKSRQSSSKQQLFTLRPYVLLRAFAKLRKATFSFEMSVCQSSTRNDSAPTG